tara:strand:- start:496 stop:2613 length:2118 start_codon:yes stop_codon:yes gene_type:complete
MNKSIKAKIEKDLYIINEYDVQHQNPEAKASPELIEYFKDKINLDTTRACINCQIRQHYKYGANEIKCNFSPRKLPDGAASKIEKIVKDTGLEKDHATKLLKASIDPVSWCELMFGFSDEEEKWFIRSYQKEQLRCTSKRMAILEGRRAGKTFAMALKLIYHAYNSKLERGRDAQGRPVYMGPTIMIVTPYQAQLTNIFEEIEKLVKRNFELKQEITSGTGDSLYVKTPTYKMEFRNGALIQGFVSGIGMRQDGSGGGTMRGFSANIIYLDEMDMIPGEVLTKVINPILATTPDTVLYATSTPIGEKGKFYEWTKRRNDFKADHLPTSVLPFWEEIKEDIIRDSTPDSFLAEYMGVFIEDEKGVFKKEWVNNARLDYTYADCENLGTLGSKLGVKSLKDMIIAIGIDWNKNAGTEFYVAGYLPAEGIWLGLDAVNVSASEFSAKRWIRELVSLNYKWKPDHIYADEGYGHTIIEDIKYESYTLRGKKNKTDVEIETAKIADKLVAFNFSSNLKLKDPITNKDIKKTGKHFLVENTVRVLQERLFKFPYEDERLKEQFFNYIIVKYNNQNNKPVYGKANEQVGDHRLDALMLALGALVLEESVYSGKQMFPSVPSFHKLKEIREKGNEAKEFLDDMKRAQFPGALHLLDIKRQERGFTGRKKEDNVSILEGINKYQGTSQGMRPISELNHAKRRGIFNRPNKRSWK